MRRSFLALQQAPRVIPSNEDERMETCFELVPASAGKGNVEFIEHIGWTGGWYHSRNPRQADRFWK